MIRTVMALVSVAFLAAAGVAQTVGDLVRIEGHGDTVLQGLGLVTGLPGTGDSGKDAVLARPLAELYRNQGNPIGSIEELAKSKSVALVSIEVTIPSGGARIGDTLDAIVSVRHSAASLKGGRLMIAPVSGPLPGQGVYAFAAGEITLDDPSNPTVGRVRLGARVSKDILMPEIGDRFRVVLKPAFAGYAAASHVANTINDTYFGRTRANLAPVATAQDDRMIVIDVPEHERADRPAFVAMVLGVSIEPSLMKLPARVIVNQASGQIILTADVEINPVGIMDADLVITTTTPPPTPTEINPIVERSRMAPLAKGPMRPAQTARLQDLLNAFKQLDVPVKKQVQILRMLEKLGQLRAELIVD